MAAGKKPEAKKPEAKKPGTAVAQRANTNVVSIRDQLKKDATGVDDRTAPAGGDTIVVGQDKTFRLPTGQKTDGPIDLIIVDFASMNAYYDGLKYDPKDIRPPGCFALGLSPTTLVPNKNSPNIQSKESCAKCPNNEFGSDGDGKACKNMRILAVLPPDAVDDTPLAVLKVSPTAIKGFDSYVKAVAAKFEITPAGVLTEVSFNDSMDYPSLLFGNPRPLTDEQMSVAFAKREEARKRIMQEPDVSKWEAPSGKKAAGGKRR